VKQFIWGTAGHIDHGKTSLVRALTGTNTDRLKEEQARGITIELGFAEMTLPSGRHLGVVDVPGHEKFVKNMVAGATGIDFVTLVIAADEGVMPQTREHMEICTLLGIRHGLVVLTKIDMVDEEWLTLITEDIKAYVKGTFLEEAPIVPVSSTMRIGLEDLIDTLDVLTEKISEKNISTLFRLPIDRVFTIKGFGTVITGTLISGKVRVGDAISICPSGIQSKVRGIQAHGEMLEEAHAGMRTAINFQGLEKESVQKGEILCQQGTLFSSFMIDLDFLYLSGNDKPLKNRARVRFHTGTSEILGNLILLDRDEISPGDRAFTQIRLEEPVCLVQKDRFVLRSYSPIRTIGGGSILNPLAAKHKRFHQEVIETFSKLENASDAELVELQTFFAGIEGITFMELQVVTGLSGKKLEDVLKDVLSSKSLVLIDRDERRYISSLCLNQLKEKVLQLLESYHRKNPLKSGMGKEEIRSQIVPVLSSKVFTLLINSLIKEEKIKQQEDLVKLFSHEISLGVDLEGLREKLKVRLNEAKLMPPTVKEIEAELSIKTSELKDILRTLTETKEIVRVKDDLYFSYDAIDTLKNILVEFLKEHTTITMPEFKDLTNVSRKFMVPLIEYFDAQHVTIRIGEARKLRGI